MRILGMILPALLMATPAAAIEPNTSCIRFENIGHKPQPSEGHVDVSWKVDATNTCTKAETITFEIEFLDADGFRVHLTLQESAWIKAGQTKTLRGINEYREGQNRPYCDGQCVGRVMTGYEPGIRPTVRPRAGSGRRSPWTWPPRGDGSARTCN
ncbi:MAG: hypothetical protein ACREM1_24100, partial [Longimicrobiales bacterium]